MDRGAWWVTVHRVAKSQTRLNDLAQHSTVTPDPHVIKTSTDRVRQVKKMSLSVILYSHGCVLRCSCVFNSWRPSEP